MGGRQRTSLFMTGGEEASKKKQKGREKGKSSKR